MSSNEEMFTPEFLDVGAEIGCVLDGHGLVGTPCGKHLDFKAVVLDFLVVFQRIDRVVGGADHLDVVATHDVAGRVGGCGELGVAFVEDLARSGGAEQFLDAERRLQFEVGPVIERIPHSVRNSLCPFLEFLPVGGVLARAVFLVDAVGPHRAPFVMVAAEPDFGDGTELVVIGHHLRNQVAVIVDDGHLGCMLVKQFLRGFGLQQEIFRHKIFHGIFFFED